MTAPTHPMIFALMSEALRDLPPMGKDERNEKLAYRFRGIDTILSHLNPLLAKKGLAFTCEYDELSRDVRPRGPDKVMVLATVRGKFTVYAPDGSAMFFSAYGEGFDTADKATMKAETAALKVALSQTFLIPTHDATDPDRYHPEGDDDDGAPAPRPSSPAPSSTHARPQEVGAGVPNWWKKNEELPDVIGTANDETGAGVPVVGCIRFDPFARPESGSKEKRWLSLNKTPWEGLSWLGLVKQQVALYKAGTKPTTENSAIEWLLTTAGRGAYKGKGNWIGETCVALDFFAGKIGGKKPEAAVAPDFDPNDPNIPGINLDDIPF